MKNFKQKLSEDKNNHDFSIVNMKNGSVVSINSTDINRKYFAIVTACGHCTKNHYIPIMFDIVAQDMDMAIESVKHYPRVKYSDTSLSYLSKDVILAAYEVSRAELVLIHRINNRDSYLSGNSFNEKDQEREIIKRNYLEELIRKDVSMLKYDIKTADEYPEELVLQRYFAPIKQGNSFVYKKIPRKESLLRDYIYQHMKDLPICKDNIHDFYYYLRAYGQPNDLNVSFNQESLLINRDGHIYTLAINQKMFNQLKRDEAEDWPKPKPETNEDIEQKPTIRPSQIEKFRRRLGQKPQNSAEDEPSH